MLRQSSPAFAALCALALAACGAPDDGAFGGGEDAPPFPRINAENPSRADLIAVCLHDQSLYSEAACACAADKALAEYSLKVRQLLVMDNNLEPTPEELAKIGSLTDEERGHFTGHGFDVMRACAGRLVPG
ncbi:MAG: hypothetical protein AAFX86_08710 [Pseudomonadota bacterium]